MEGIASNFVQFYYTTFDSGKRADLKGLYRDNSMLSFEGQQFLGANAIAEKLESLSFDTVQHTIVTLDPQPSSVHASMIVLVTGQLLMEAGGNPIHFSQTFQLLPENESYYVLNDVFRLNYG